MGGSWGSVEKWFHSGHIETKLTRCHLRLDMGTLVLFFIIKKYFIELSFLYHTIHLLHLYNSVIFLYIYKIV